MNKSLNFRNDGGLENRDDDPRGGGIDSRFRMVDGIDEKRVPRHIAIIMDGNGRWAEARGLSRFEGHQAGTENLRRVIRDCISFGIHYLTIYAFSTENWGRPKEEVTGLMTLLESVIDNELPELMTEGVQIRHMGNLAALSSGLQEKFKHAIEVTTQNRNLVLNIAWNYGGRNEIVHAIQRIIRHKIALRQ